MSAREVGRSEISKLLEELDGLVKYPGVRCPKCRWSPRKSSRWSCREKCRNSWNTFDTRGYCEKCKFHWLSTQCLACGAWSLHQNWYEQPEERS